MQSEDGCCTRERWLQQTCVQLQPPRVETLQLGHTVLFEGLVLHVEVDHLQRGVGLQPHRCRVASVEADFTHGVDARAAGQTRQPVWDDAV